MLVDHHRATSKRTPEPTLVQLPVALLDRDRVVFGNDALSLHREDPLQIGAGGGLKCRSVIGRLHRELLVELRNVSSPQELIGSFRRGDCGQSQLLRQATLPGAKASLAPSSRLRRVRGDHLYTQFFHRPANLGRPVFVNLFACFDGYEEVAAPVTIERTKQSLLLDHLTQPLHHRPGRFLLHQLRIVDFAGRVIQNDNQVAPTVIAEPLVFATVNVQHHAWQRTPFPSPAMLLSGSASGH